MAAQPRFVPWLKKKWQPRNASSTSPALLTHEEVIQFANWVSPTPAERQMRNTVCASISAVVKDLWPTATVRVMQVLCLFLVTAMWGGKLLRNKELDLYSKKTTPTDTSCISYTYRWRFTGLLIRTYVSPKGA